MEDKIICKFCNKEISKEKYGIHLKTKHLNEFKNSIELYRYFFSVKENIDLNMIDNIIEDYKDNSVLYIEDKYNIKFRRHIPRLGLKQKSISESRKTVTSKNKQKETNKLIYGVENVSQSKLIKDKKKKTFLKNYGVDNIWKLKEYRIWWEEFIINKYGKVCLSDLYGNQNSWGWNEMSMDEKKIRISKIHKAYIKWYDNLPESEKLIFNQSRSKGILKAGKSKLELRIENILINNQIYNKSQFWVDRKSYDFYLGNKNILEVQGTYWHCDPRKYCSTDIVKFGDDIYQVSDIWERDKIKKEIAESYGYKMYYIWEIEINKMSDDEILIFIQKINENKIN